MSKQLFSNLIRGLLPLAVLLAVEGLWGMWWGLGAALLVGSAEFLIAWRRERRPQPALLIDLLLVLLLGTVLILMGTEVADYLRQGVIQTFLVLVLSIPLFFFPAALSTLLERYLPGEAPPPPMLPQLRRILARFFVLLVVHTALVFVSPLLPFPEWRQFIRGWLFYMLVAALFLWQILQNRLAVRHASGEWVPLVTAEGVVIGKATREAVHRNRTLIHPVVHLHIMDSKGRLLLQKRSSDRLVEPDKWDCAVGGHLAAGETRDQALVRETAEELGVALRLPPGPNSGQGSGQRCEQDSRTTQDCRGLSRESQGTEDLQCRYLFHQLHSLPGEQELAAVYLAHNDGPFRSDCPEFSELRFWSRQEIQAALGKGVFTPSFELEFSRLAAEIGANRGGKGNS